jgi:seryl-tRNA synthetase
MPASIAGDFLSKLHYVSEDLAGFELDAERRDVVRFGLRPSASHAPELIASRIAETADKFCERFREIPDRVLGGRPVTGSFTEDPHPLLERAGELHRFGSGRFALGPRIVGLMALLERHVLELARDFKAPHFQFPALIGADVLDRCKYFKSFPHSLNIVAHLREDVEAIQHFAKTAAWKGDHLEVHAEDLAPVEVLLSPSVCFHYYESLRGTTLNAPRTVTAVGKCFRYESGNMGGLERLWDFSMREVIFVGPRQHVLDSRERSIGLTQALLERWEIGYEIRSATDPFFTDDFWQQAAFQRAFDLKFEIRAVLPYKDSTLAAGSFNFHQDFFGRSFNITDHEGAPTHTGCIAFGLERVALAFLAQHGLDVARWPDVVARDARDWVHVG